MIRQEKERLRHTQRPKVIDLAYSEHAALTLLTPDSARQVLCKRAAIGKKMPARSLCYRFESDEHAEHLAKQLEPTLS